ncbi:MAG: Gfo/Idh/MocA family oxidoreductase [Chloroflexota bacterium]
MTRLTVGVIGLGEMGRIHARNLAALPTARLLAVASRRHETGQTVASALDVPRVYTDYQALLADGDLEAVIIAANTSEHAELIVAAAQARKAIFGEKPAALTLDEMDRALEAVSAAGVPFQIGFMRRFDPPYVAAKRQMEDGGIGRPVAFLSISRDPCLPAPEDKSALARGNLFLDLGIHDYDLAGWLMGSRIVEVYATGGALVYPQLHEFSDLDNAQVMLRFADGAIGSINLSRNARYGYDVRTEVLGSRGALHIGQLRQVALDVLDGEGVHFQVYPWYQERFAAAYRLEMEHFVAHVRGQKAAQATGEEGRLALQTALAVTESFRHGRPVSLPGEGST